MLKLVLFLFILCGVAVYFIPSFIAIGRKHVHVMQITILNAFLGWSFIAWVAALIWATTKNTDESIETKDSWIMISIFAVLSILPLLIFIALPQQYKLDTMQEVQYKKVIYTTDIDTKTGKVIRKVIEIKHEEDDKD